jgi:hypothetical protein
MCGRHFWLASFTFIATQMPPSGAIATSATWPSSSLRRTLLGHRSLPSKPERLWRLGRGMPAPMRRPASITSPSGVSAMRLVRLPSGPGIDQAALPASGAWTSKVASSLSS